MLGDSGVLGPSLQHKMWSDDSDIIHNVSSIHTHLYCTTCVVYCGPYREDTLPAVTALKYKNALTLAVGTASGQVSTSHTHTHTHTHACTHARTHTHTHTAGLAL